MKVKEARRVRKTVAEDLNIFSGVDVGFYVSRWLVVDTLVT